MRNVIKVMAKEVRRIRALVETRAHYRMCYRLGYGVTGSANHLNTLRRMLALMIKAEQKA